MKNRGEKSAFLITATVFLLLISSCTSKKKMLSPMAHAADYEWMTAKMKGEVTVTSYPSPFAFSGSLRMHRDSLVWLSVSAFMGMESIRALITQDSVFMINRLNQTYVAEPISAVAQTLHAPSLQECQTMLLGNGTNDHVTIQFGPYMAKIQYSDIQWETPAEVPFKINKKYERIKL